MIWADPAWFWLLLILPLVGGIQFWHFRRKRIHNLTFSEISVFKDLPGNTLGRFFWLPYAFQHVALLFLILALARPQEQNVLIERSVEGIDIMLVLDISSSMLAEDLQPNRLLACKAAAEEFINMRENDRIGLVIFARESFTVCPPTLDYRLLRKQLAGVDLGMVRDGTAIGMGLATAVNRLRDSDAESRVIILLTDGENNAGEIDPITAGQLAQAYGIRVHVIGASVDAPTAPYPVNDPIFGTRYHQIPVAIDEDQMRAIANMTGGVYLRATDNISLLEVYREIDRMETSRVDEIIYRDYKDHYPRFLWLALVMIVVGAALNTYLYRSFSDL